MVKQIVGLDIGYRQTKAVCPGEPMLIFPSVVAPDAGPGFETDITGPHEKWNITFKDAHYLVGPEALRLNPRLVTNTLARERTGSPEFMALVGMALLKLFPNGARDLGIVTGLPHAWLKDTARLQTLLTGTHYFQLGNASAKTYEISEVEVVPQAFGTLTNEAFSYNGTGFSTKNKPLIEKPSAIVDFGGLTTNFQKFDNGYVHAESDSLETGVVRILEQLGRAILTKHDLDLSLAELEKAYINGYIEPRGQTIDILSLLDPIIATQVNIIASHAYTLWSHDIHSVLATGGGSYRQGAPFIKEYAHPSARIVAQPEQANCAGLLLYAQWNWL